MKRYLLFLLFFAMATVLQAAPVKVASLHPLLSDMAAEIGGKRIKIVNMFPQEMDLHSFVPGSEHFSSAAGAKLVLLCGKGIEAGYMDVLQDSFGSRTVLLELGKNVPDVTISPDSPKIDPHWWNNPENMKIAASALADALTELDPAGKKDFAKGAERYCKTMDALMTKTRAKMSLLPENRRLLVTSHPGMAHFCKAFGLTPCPVNVRDDASDIVASLKDKGIVCVFYDATDLSDATDLVAEGLGCRTKPIFMDGIYPTMKAYGTLFSLNVASIYNNLRDKEAEAAMEAKSRSERFEEIRRRYEDSKKAPAPAETPAE